MLPAESLPMILENMACYLECLPLDPGLGSMSNLWGAVLLQLESLYRRILFLLNSLDEITPLVKIMVCILKVPVIVQYKVSANDMTRGLL